jgi:hypothetical protein
VRAFAACLLCLFNTRINFSTCHHTKNSSITYGPRSNTSPVRGCHNTARYKKLEGRSEKRNLELDQMDRLAKWFPILVWPCFPGVFSTCGDHGVLVVVSMQLTLAAMLHWLT